MPSLFLKNEELLCALQQRRENTYSCCKTRLSGMKFNLSWNFPTLLSASPRACVRACARAYALLEQSWSRCFSIHEVREREREFVCANARNRKLVQFFYASKYMHKKSTKPANFSFLLPPPLCMSDVLYIHTSICHFFFLIWFKPSLATIGFSDANRVRISLYMQKMPLSTGCLRQTPATIRKMLTVAVSSLEKTCEGGLSTHDADGIAHSLVRGRTR